MIILGLILIALKLTHTVDWSWLLILAPFWAPYALTFLWAHHLATGKRTTRSSGRRKTTRGRKHAFLGLF